MGSELTIRLPPERRDALDHASRRLGVQNPRSSGARSATSPPSSHGLRPVERVRDLLGSLESGIDDLAERHRDYILDSLKR